MSEQTATFDLYSMNWLFSVTRIESVYRAVLTEPLTTTDYVMSLKLLKPTGHVMHQQFNIQQLYVLTTLYLCILYLSENKQRLVPLTA